MSKELLLTPALKFELEGMKATYQDKIAELLNYASAMGDYGNPHGILAVISPDTGKVLKCDDEAQLAKVLPLIRKEEREKRAKSDFIWQQQIEEAKREERERIFNKAEEMCPHYGNKNNKLVKRYCDDCWQALKGETDGKTN